MTDQLTFQYEAAGRDGRMVKGLIGAADEAHQVLAEAVASHGPVLVEVDLEALGPMKSPFPPPVSLPGT